MSSPLDAYTSTVDLAIKAMDAVFMRLNAAEAVKPESADDDPWHTPIVEREEDEAHRAANYEVAPEHWGARLALMAAWHALHAARRIVATDDQSALGATPWYDAAALAKESARLSECAAEVFAETTETGRDESAISTRSRL